MFFNVSINGREIFVKNNKIAAVVVTYNKSKLLEENLSSLLNQTLRLDKIIVIDNCSTDNTGSLLEEYSKKYDAIEYHRLEKNIGGAGGFNTGIKIACKGGYDYIWIMDDDTIPNSNALEMMVENKFIKENSNWGYICSNVLWVDNNPCLMNIPAPHKIWNDRIGYGLVRLACTSFVSILIKRSVVEEVGLPISEFFIWGDDYEYTTRISQKYPGYMAIDSVVVHKMNKNTDVNIVAEEGSRVDRYYFEFRNKFFIMRNEGKKNTLHYFLYVLKTIVKVLKSKNDNKKKKIKVILKGMFHGFRFRPKVEYLEK